VPRPESTPKRSSRRSLHYPGWSLFPRWRRDALRTTLWVIPSVLVAIVGLLFLITWRIDWSVYHGHLSLPRWIHFESGDAARQVLIGIAAAIITVIGVVFSITILALTLASQQFGPRMLRNFVRDIGTQVTLGIFVATFVYAVLTLDSLTQTHRGEFVPHLSITVALGLVLLDLAVLIYFIHHIARSIQLPEVIAGIARDLGRSIDVEFPPSVPVGSGDRAETNGPSLGDLQTALEREGAAVPALTSGYLQFIGYPELLAIAQQADAVIELVYRPGHFIIAGGPLATVWPPEETSSVAQALARFHVTGPHRTLVQDPVFAIDQLVEIAIRALSPAVNDTFTALTCIDWLSDGLCKISTRPFFERIHRDGQGRIRVIERGASYERIVNRAFDKIRQAGRGMPAVAIRQMDSVARILPSATSSLQRRVLVRQADMILSASEEGIAAAEDRADVRRRYESVVIAARNDRAADERPDS
jgi:uncharacterized membrane protein